MITVYLKNKIFIEGAFMGLISKGNISNAKAAFPEFMSFLGNILCIL